MALLYFRAVTPRQCHFFPVKFVFAIGPPTHTQSPSAQEVDINCSSAIIVLSIVLNYAADQSGSELWELVQYTCIVLSCCIFRLYPLHPVAVPM